MQTSTPPLHSNPALLSPAAPPVSVPGRSLLVDALAAMTALGFLARLVLSWYSLGTNDWGAWWGFSALAAHHGPFQPYRMDGHLNHPPLPLLWSALALAVAAISHASFPFVFRLAAIAADAGSCAVLYRVWSRRRGDARWGWAAAAAFAWNLDALLVGAYHCNTDNVCAFLTLLAAYQLADRRNFFAGGLALAGAINVKLVPVVLIPAVVSLCRDRRDLWRLAKGLAVGAVPFAVVLCAAPVEFSRNVLAYKSIPGEWGLMLFAMDAQHVPAVAVQAAATVRWLHLYGKYPLLALAAGLGVVSWRWRRWDAYEMAAMGWCVFLVFTPGFGLQYVVYAAPLLMAVSPGRGALYGLVAGLYLLAKYAGAWTGTWPLESSFDPHPGPNPLAAPLGLLAWGILVGFLAVTLRRPAAPGAAAAGRAGGRISSWPRSGRRRGCATS